MKKGEFGSGHWPLQVFRGHLVYFTYHSAHLLFVTYSGHLRINVFHMSKVILPCTSCTYMLTANRTSIVFTCSSSMCH